MYQDKDFKISKNKVDQQEQESSPFEQYQMKTIREQLTQQEKEREKKQLEDDPKSFVPKYDEFMAKEDMLEQIIIDFKTLKDRKFSKQDADIFAKNIFTAEDKVSDPNQAEIDLFKRASEIIKIQDLTSMHHDFFPNINHLEDLYFKDKIEKINDWNILDKEYRNGTRKHYTVSSFVEIKELHERYLISYQIELRKKDNQFAWITQCYVFRYNPQELEFQQVYSFLADINSNATSQFYGRTKIFNKVFINSEGLFYLMKNQSQDENGQLFNSVVVNQIQLQQLQKEQKYGFIFSSEHAEQVFKINLDQKIDMEELDIGFAQNLNPNSKIIDQFVMIYQYQDVKNKELTIFSMKNHSNPLVLYQNTPLEALDYAFVAQKNDDEKYFIIKNCQMHCEIKYEGYNELIIDEQSQKQLKFSENYNYQESRYDNQQMIAERLLVNLADSENIDQFYFIDCYGNVQLIHPFEEDAERRASIEKYIANYHQLEQGKGVCIFLKDSGNIYQHKREDTQNLFKYLNKCYDLYDEFYKQCLLMPEMIIAMNFAGQLSALVLEKDDSQAIMGVQKDSFFSKQNSFFQRMYDQFNNSSQSQVYQDNYFNINYHITDQNINEMYLIKSKQEAVLGHNFIIMKNKKYIFHENNLIILNESNGRFDIQLLKLYSDYVTNTKLVKIHFSNSYAVFFFLNRQDKKGVYFYLIISQQDLSLLIQKQDFLIKEDTNIFIMNSIDSIEQIKFNLTEIKKLGEYDKYVIASRNEFVFELSRDLADPTKDFLPFLFYQRVDQYKFEIFLCFLNVNQAGEHLKQKKQREEIHEVRCEDFIKSFPIQFYQRADEPILFKNCEDNNSGMRRDVLAHQWRSQNMFCRSSNWEKINNEKQFQALFQVGFNVLQNNLSSIEVREYFVSIDLNNYGSQYYHNVKVNPIKMQNVLLNQNYLNEIILSRQDYKQSIENHRLIPKVDDDGNIYGSMILFNLKQYRYGIWQITDDIQVIQNYCPNEDAQALHDSLVFVTEISESNFSGYSIDGKPLQDLSNEILVKNQNKTAFKYHVINLDDQNMKLNW